MCIKPRNAGFTLVETMIASGITSLMMVVLASFSFYSARTCAGFGNYSELETQSRMALDHMTQEIRQAQAMQSFTTNTLVFTDADGGTLTFTYDADARKLLRSKLSGGVTTESILLEGCDFAKFDVFQRNPIGGTYDAYPTMKTGTAKLIQVSWICSRSLMGVKANTESVQSAKIVIRKG